MATYPSQVLVKGNVINEVDVVDQNDHNILKNEIIALQTYVGTTPQGGFSDFASRVNFLLNGTGVVQNSTGFPANTTPVRLFYRTDLETLYIRRFDNSGWQAIGASPSNVLYSWKGVDGYLGGTAGGLYAGTSNDVVMPATAPGNMMLGNLFYISPAASDTHYFFTTKFYKISGITTIIPYVRVWARGGAVVSKGVININSGTVIGTTGSVTASTPTWVSGSIDVTALTNGTVYDLSVGITRDFPVHGYMSGVVLFGQ